MNNAVYGKTLENMRNRTKMMLVNDGEKLLLFLGAAVLDKSKHHVFQFQYDHTTKVYGEDMRIRYTDTDSFHIK